MEKRFVLFIVLSLVVLTGYALIKSMIAPEKPAIVRQADDAGEAAQDDAGEAAQDDPRAAADTPAADTPAADTPAADAPASDTPAADTPAADTAAPATDAAEDPKSGITSDAVGAATSQWAAAWISRGSYDPVEGPPLLVTWNARGATVERIELTERDKNGKLRYRELLDRSGYLGHLALTSDPSGGCRVNVVGHGTPAARAKDPDVLGPPGLQIGDVIHHADGTSITTPADLKKFLDKTVPEQTIRLEVRRSSGDPISSGGTVSEMQLITTLKVHPLQLIQPERPIAAADGVALHPSSFLFSLIQLDDRKATKGAVELDLGVSLREENWQWLATKDGQGVEFHLEVAPVSSDGVPIKLELVKRFRLGDTQDVDNPTTPYHLDYEIEIRNLSDKPHRIAYRQDGPNGLPLEGFWYSNKLHPTMFYVAGARDVVWKAESRSGFQADSEVLRSYDHELVGCSEIYKTASKAKSKNKSAETVLFDTNLDDDGDRMPLYVAIDTQYFVAAMKPVSKQQMVYDMVAAYVLGDLGDIPKAARKSTNVSFHLDSQAFTLAAFDPQNPEKPAAKFNQGFEVYAGPKVPDLLAAYNLQDCIYYGWFGTVSKLLAVVLHFFFAMVRNYGLAIILLTVLVRSGMFPLSRKAAKNAAMMQALAPQMKKITEKYKEDMEKRAKAQQELFKKHNYNPFGGCWMMFLQLPIFIGLYRCLSVDINLRQAALVPGITWCSNLAGPDMLFAWPERFTWSLFTEMGMLGPYFNILPMFTVALFLIQQKLFTPPPTDDQSRMQLTMMKYMTVFIGVMFFKVAAGLCLYFIASSLWGIAERKLLPKPKIAADGGPVSEPPPAKPKPKPKPPRPKPKLPDNGKSGRQQPRSKKKRR